MKMTTTKTRTIENTCFKPVYLAGSNPALSAMKKARESVLFSMISVPWGTDIYNICKANILRRKPYHIARRYNLNKAGS